MLISQSLGLRCSLKYMFLCSHFGIDTKRRHFLVIINMCPVVTLLCIFNSERTKGIGSFVTEPSIQRYWNGNRRNTNTKKLNFHFYRIMWHICWASLPETAPCCTFTSGWRRQERPQHRCFWLSHHYCSPNCPNHNSNTMPKLPGKRKYILEKGI